MEYKQTKLGSLCESTMGALVAAPTAMLLHKILLIVAGENALNETQDLFIIISWITFFLHSVFWKFVVRRIHERFGIKLDPLHLIIALKKRL